MDENIRTIRREKWRTVVMSQKESGLSITEFCRQNGLRARQFHYWQKVLRDYELPNLTPSESGGGSAVPMRTAKPNSDIQVFAELPAQSQSSLERFGDTYQPGPYSQNSGLMIRYQDLQIGIADCFSEEALSRVLKVIRNA